MTPMRATLLPSLLLLCATLAPAQARAGGIALLDTVGFHNGPALTVEGGRQTWFDSGLGGELFLGKRHGRAEARFRFFWAANVRRVDDEAQVEHSGALGVGGRIELLKDTTARAGLYIGADLGVSPVVQHNRAYFYVGAGPGLRIDLAGPLSFFTEPTFVVRVDDSVSVGAWLNLGLRANFD